MATTHSAVLAALGVTALGTSVLVLYLSSRSVHSVDKVKLAVVESVDTEDQGSGKVAPTGTDGVPSESAEENVQIAVEYINELENSLRLADEEQESLVEKFNQKLLKEQEFFQAREKSIEEKYEKIILELKQRLNGSEIKRKEVELERERRLFEQEKAKFAVVQQELQQDQINFNEASVEFERKAEQLVALEKELQKRLNV